MFGGRLGLPELLIILVIGGIIGAPIYLVCRLLWAAIRKLEKDATPGQDAKPGQ